MFNLASFSCLITCLENHHKDLARNNQIAGSAAKTDHSIDKTCEESYYLGFSLGESVAEGNSIHQPKKKVGQKWGNIIFPALVVGGDFYMGVSKK